MINSYLQTILILIGITIIGAGFLVTVIDFKKLNVYLILGYGFVFGNLFIIVALSILATFNLLEFTQIAFFILLILSISLLIKFRQNLSFKINFKDILIFVCSILFFGILIFPSLLKPIDMWDSIAMWYLKGKWLFSTDGYINTNFLNNEYFVYTHLDYPNGFPLILSMFFRFYGYINESASKIFLMSSTFAMSLITVGIVKRFVEKITQLSVVGIFSSVFLTGILLMYSVSGYTESFLTLSFLSTITLFILGVHHKNDEKSMNVLLLLSIISSLFPIYIKNEGLTFFLINSFFIFIFLWNYYRKNLSFNWLYSFLGKYKVLFLTMFLATIGILLWYWIKAKYNLTNDLVSEPFVFDFPVLIEKIAVIVLFFINLLMTTQYWGFLFVPSILILISTTIYAFKNKSTRLRIFPNMVIITQSLVYFLVYVMTPHDINWHLQTSMDRLVLQLFPSVIICALWGILVVSDSLIKSVNKYENRQENY